MRENHNNLTEVYTKFIKNETELNLSNQNISDENIIWICQFLRQNQNIQKIDLSNNKEIADAGGKMLAAKLFGCKQIANVNLSNTSVSKNLAMNIENIFSNQLKLPNSFSVIQYMTSLNLKTNIDGLCHGMASMFMQAVLADDCANYIRRLYYIRYAVIMAVDEIFAKESKKSTEKIVLTAKFIQEHSNEINAIIKNEYLKLPVQEQIDISAFFEGVTLYQHMHAYPEIINIKEGSRSINKSQKSYTAFALEIFTPAKIDQDICIGNTITNHLDTSELNDFFSLLSTYLSNCSHPISYLFSANKHATSISYDPKQKHWILFDPGHPNPLYLNSIKDLVAALKTAHFCSTDTPLLFSLQTFYRKIDVDKVNASYNELGKNDHWKILNQVDIKKIGKISGTETSNLLLFAVHHNDVNKVKEIIEYFKNHNLCLDTSFAIHAAIAENKIETVEVLLDYLDDVDKDLNHHGSPMQNAIALDRLEIVSMLLQKGAQINLVRNDYTPLQLAVSLRDPNSQMIRLLLNHKADQSIRDSSGRTAIQIAENKGRLEIAEILRKHNPASTVSRNSVLFSSKGLNENADVALSAPHQKNSKLNQ